MTEVLKVLLVDNHISNRALKLATLLKPHKVETVNVQDLNRRSYRNHDLVVLSGGNVQVASSEDGTFDEELELIDRVIVPVFGVCLGMQLIARAYGARIEDLENPSQGIVRVKPTGDNPLVSDISEFGAYQNHKRTVSDLPEVLEVLGQSRDGVEIIKHRDYPIVGVQFHPESDAHGSEGKIIFERFMAQLV